MEHFVSLGVVFNQLGQTLFICADNKSMLAHCSNTLWGRGLLDVVWD